MAFLSRYLKFSLACTGVCFLLPQVWAAESCAPISPGITQVFAGTGSRGTPVDAEYILSRSVDHPNQFKAKVRLRFTFMNNAEPVTIGMATWTQRQEDMENQVNACLTKVNPHLLGPDGQQLKIFLEPDSSFATAPVTNIKVYHELSRSNQNEWPVSPDCEIITHEILHILGLVDGYEEGGVHGFMLGTAPQHLYDCRSLAPEDSVMREPYQSLEAGKSLLYEEEFKIITVDKRCTLQSSKYLECAQNARLTSRLFLGVRTGCVEVSPDCNSSDWFGKKTHE